METGTNPRLRRLERDRRSLGQHVMLTGSFLIGAVLIEMMSGEVPLSMLLGAAPSAVSAAIIVWLRCRK